MKILYLSLSYLPSRRASSVHVMRMCSAMARAGHQVRLVAKRGEPNGEDDFAFYGAPQIFEIRKLPRPARRGGSLVFALAMTRLLLANRSRHDLIYSRDLLGALVATQFRLRLVFEAHAIPTQPTLRRILRLVLRAPSLRRLVVISDALRRDLIAEGFPVPRDTVVAHDAADLPSDAPAFASRSRVRVGYVGSLYEGRGIETVIEVARSIPECDVEIVGGTTRDLERWRARALPNNLRLVGFIPPADVPSRLRSFDVLLMPHAKTNVRAFSGSDISRWTSPMKLFEYMASGVPIVASDLPVLSEVLDHERTALIANADDPHAWETAVRRLMSDAKLRKTLATNAYSQLERCHTWDARVAHVLGGLGLA